MTSADSANWDICRAGFTIPPTPFCEPTDLPVNKRQLDMLLAHMALSDKPFMGAVTDPSRAQDSVEMCEILFGKEFVQQNRVMTSLININSLMTFDDVMTGSLEIYARSDLHHPALHRGRSDGTGVGGGALTQVMAEVLADVAYSQLVRAGAPVIMGAFVISIDMNSGVAAGAADRASLSLRRVFLRLQADRCTSGLRDRQ